YRCPLLLRPHSVMAGLVPAIHVFAKRPEVVDARDISAFTRVFDALCPGMTTESVAPSSAHELRHHGALLVEVGSHPVYRAFRLELGGKLIAQIRILHVVGDRGPALWNIHGGVVGVLLTGWSGLAAGIVRPEPGGQPEALLGGIEVLVEPAR